MGDAVVRKGVWQARTDPSRLVVYSTALPWATRIHVHIAPSYTPRFVELRAAIGVKQEPMQRAADGVYHTLPYLQANPSNE